MVDAYVPTLKFVARLSSSLFAGFAGYCSLVEHPSMVDTGAKAAADHFNAMFKRAASLQTALSLTSAASSFAVYYLRKEKQFLYSGILLFSILPYTLVTMMNTNLALLDPALNRESATSKQLIEKWGHLHAFRSLIGLAAVSFILYNVQ